VHVERHEGVADYGPAGFVLVADVECIPLDAADKVEHVAAAGEHCRRRLRSNE